MEVGIKWITNTYGRKKESETGPEIDFLGESAASTTRKFIKSFPQYEITPLRSLANLADYTGVSGIYVKDESYRFGLNSF
jgi:diaminopropionate ammonia-lyase